MKHGNKKNGFLFILCMLLSTLTFAQQRELTGTVKDNKGEPLPGVSILIKSNGTGTATDMDGKYALNVSTGDVLVFSFIGYKPQTIAIADQKVLNIVLEDDVEQLQEVVVIGYGSVKKNDATGSVTAIKPDELSKGITTSAQDMLTGKIAGVSVISNDGAPGAGAQIRIRGGSSLNASNDPLIVIDGLAIDNEGIKGMGNGLAMVNPEDIETFTVLKDASATAIYGSRASNGVILITTKKGKVGSKLSVSYSGNVSVATTQDRYEVMNGDEFREYVTSRFGADVPVELGTANTDWQDEIFRVAVSTDHHLSFNGAIKNLPFRVSVGYTDQNGIIETSHMQRVTTSINLAPTFFNDHLKFNVTAKYMYGKNRYADAGSAIGNALTADPTQPVYMDSPTTGGYWQNLQSANFNDPNWGLTTNPNTPSNPLATLKLQNKHANSHDFTGNVDVDYKVHFLPDLHIHANIGGEYAEGDERNVISPYSFSNNYFGWDGMETQYKYNLSYNVYAQYSKTLGSHALDIMAGGEEQHFHRNGFSYGQGTNPLTGEAHNPTSREQSAYATRNTLVSYFGRLNYTLADKYLLTFTMRWDGSSRFDKDNRWGTFPSLALGWKIKEENFLKDANVLSDLKLRLGWGITGQQNVNSDFGYAPLYVIGNDYVQYPFGNQYYYTSRPNAFNKDLKWEKTTTYNAGLDFGFLNGRITGAIDGYYRKTKDLLNSVKIPVGTNFNLQLLSNIGSLENYGMEFSVTTTPVVTDNFTWNLSYNVTWNHNEITKLTGGNDESYYVETGDKISPGNNTKVQAHKVGYAAKSFYVYQQVYDENGNPIENMFVDRNGDGIINSEDKYIFKDPAPDVTMGLTSKMLYKNWDFSFALRTSFNNYVYYDFLADKARVGGSYLASNNSYHNQSKEAQALGFTGVGDYYMSDYFVRNASFLRCDNITLGYSFKNLFKGNSDRGVRGRIYATVQNPFIVSKYKGLDPEVSSGIDSNPYPRATTFLLGVNLQF